MTMPQWMVVRTRPRWERIVGRQLKDWYGIVYYAPCRKEKRQYTDRIKEVSSPLFRNYIFVQLAEQKQQLQVLQLDGVLDFVRYLGRPAVIRDGEMQELQDFVTGYTQVHLLEAGQQVILNNGLLKGQKAIVQSARRNRVVLHLTQLGFRLEATPDELITEG